jgi:hypothetical protein
VAIERVPANLHRVAPFARWVFLVVFVGFAASAIASLVQGDESKAFRHTLVLPYALWMTLTYWITLPKRAGLVMMSLAIVCLAIYIVLGVANMKR